MSALSDREVETAVMPQTVRQAEAQDVESCRSCGGLVARHQRYCLSCGGRRMETRVPFAETLGKTPATAAAPAAAVAARSASAFTPAMAAAFVCLAVLFLGTGVLVGRSGNSAKPAAAVAPQVITVPAGGADGGGADTAAADSAAAGPKKDAAAKDQPKAAPPKPLTAKQKAQVDAAANCKTEKECQEASKKIPNEFVSSGRTVKEDNKPPAGGAKGMVIGG